MTFSTPSAFHLPPSTLRPPPSMSFSDLLRAERARLNLSQSECAALIPHLSHRMIAKWEAGAGEPPLWAQALLLAALAKAKPRKKTGHFGKPGNPNF